MSKTHLYFVPGMAANSQIYEHIELDSTLFETHFLEWKIPISQEETMPEYAQRMCDEITHENPVLIGVSFGGLMVQEMSKIIPTKKVIIISSIKSNQELSKRFKVVAATKVYKLFPAKFLENIDSYIDYFLGDYQKHKIEAYKKFLSVRNADYLHWAIFNALHWQQTEEIKDIIHIHGTKDGVFPIKHIHNCIEVKNGTHAMILIKAKKISSIIRDTLTCK
jgi:pimeloyl-ACP methyl ester carboxylesterase